MCTIVLILNARPKARKKALLKFAATVGLDMPAHLTEPLRRRLLTRQRSRLIGAIVGTLLSIPVLMIWPSDSQWHSLDSLLIVSAAFIGTVVGSSFSAIRATTEPDNDSVRYARAEAVELYDYMGPLGLWLPRVSVALAAGVTLILAIFVQLGFASLTGVSAAVCATALVTVAIGSLVAFEIVGRRVIAMGNRVKSAEELVWEDATRSLTLRELSTTPIFIGFYTALMGFSPFLVTAEPGHRAVVAIATLTAGLVIMAIAIAMLVNELSSKRHFLRRLWPELVAPVSSTQPSEVE